jgi:opacity protein-like surface antigen
VRLGGVVSNASPSDEGYESRFLTPGSTLGARVDLDARGPLCFTLGAERFTKAASAGTGWDGEISAMLITAFPSVRLPVIRGGTVFAGPGAVYVDGRYSGTDSFDRFVEASGSSLGFGFCFGMDISIAGPVSGRLEYRRAFIDMKTDKAIIDGQSRALFPAEEADLGYQQFGFTMLIGLFGGENSLLGGL